jgi:arabinofuranosyltransferase
VVTAPGTERRALPRLLLCLIVAGAAAISWFVVAQRYWLDDSFITFRYFRNLFDGHGIAYNPGEFVEGYTNFLWGVVAWIGMHLGAEPMDFTQWVSLIAQALTLLVVYRIGLAATGSRLRALLAPALLAGQVAFVSYPMTGMESTFFCFLVTLAFWLLNSEAHDTRRGGVALGLVLVAMGMTRFDGFVLVAILGAYWVLVKRDMRRLWLPTGVFVLGWGLYNLWRLTYYPTLLPNSFHAKINLGVMRMFVGANQMGGFFLEGQQIALVLAVIALALFRRSATRSFLSWVVVMQIAYIVVVGGDWMPHYRFVYHVMPLLFLLVQDGAWEIWDSVREKAGRPALSGALLLVVLLGLNVRPLYLGREFSELSGDHFNAHEARLIGEKLDEVLPEEMLIAIEWGGIIPFYTRHKVLDTFGLTDKDITSKPFKRAIWGRLIDPQYIRSREADVVVPCARLFRSRWEALDAVRSPNGSCHYKYYPSMDSERLGYLLLPLKVAEDAWWPVLVRRGRWIANADGAGELPTGDLPSGDLPSGEPPPGKLAAGQNATPRYQVSVFWGGGAPRSWDGRMSLAGAGKGVEAAWSWLTDFEAGDRLVTGTDLPAPGNAGPAGAAADGAASEAPALGALIRTRTEGDADGLCFEVSGGPLTTLSIDVGDGRAQWTLGDLAAAPRTAAVGDDGNVLHATAISLDVSAPLGARHDGRLAHRVSMHNHSSFSTNMESLAATLESLRPFVRRLWWTDHNVGTPRSVLGGDFEHAGVVDRYWQVNAPDALVLAAKRDADAREGKAAYRLRAEGRGAASRASLIAGEGEWARHFRLPLAIAPELLFSWKPVDESIAYAQVTLSPGGTIRYLSARPDDFNAARDIVLPASDGGWQDHRRNLLQDALGLGQKPAKLSVLGLSVGVLCPAGGVGEALFDGVDFAPNDASELIRRQQVLLDRTPDIISHVGMESSGWRSETESGSLVPHFSVFAPGDVAALFRSAGHALSPAERTERFEEIQAAGGCIATHHMQYLDHYDTLLAGGGYSVDMLEIGSRWWRPPYYATGDELAARDALGYPPLGDDDVFPVLVRWDRAIARGLLLTGYGAPDLNGLFDRPDPLSFNRWLSWVLSGDGTPAGLLRALRSGRAVASEWRSNAIVTVDAGMGLGMGKLVVTDHARLTLTARVSEAPPGSRLRWIEVPFARARWDAPTLESPLPGRVAGEVVLGPGTTQVALEVDATLAGFVRAELYNPAGHLSALSNPVHVLPYWPERWPYGRVAFDWQGVRLLAELRLLLDDARVDAAGRLALAGTVFADQPGTLRLSADASPDMVDLSAGTWIWDDQSNEIVVTEIPPGAFDIAITFPTPLDAGHTADLLALPARKELVGEVQVGNTASEDGRLLSGFGKPRVRADVEVYRAVVEPEATFRMAVPGDRPVWLKLRSARQSAAAAPPFEGRVLLDGREVGTMHQGDALTFALPPDLTNAPQATERTFTLQVDADPKFAEQGRHPVQISRIQLYAGPGVVDY